MCCQRTKHYRGGSALLLHVCQSGCSSPPAAESLPEHPSPRTRACACVCVRPEPAASLCLLSSHCVIVHMDTAFAAVHRVLLCVGVFSARSTLLHQKLWKRLISSSSHESEHFLFTSRFTQSSLSFCSDFGLYQPMRTLADAVRSHRLVHRPAARVNSSEGSCSLCFCGKRVKNVYSHAVAAMFNGLCHRLHFSRVPQCSGWFSEFVFVCLRPSRSSVSEVYWFRLRFSGKSCKSVFILGGDLRRWFMWDTQNRENKTQNWTTEEEDAQTEVRTTKAWGAREFVNCCF